MWAEGGRKSAKEETPIPSSLLCLKCGWEVEDRVEIGAMLRRQRGRICNVCWCTLDMKTRERISWCTNRILEEIRKMGEKCENRSGQR